MLTLSNVTKTYRAGDAPALDKVSLSVERGEFVALLGPSGAGKSTLIRSINGLVQPDAGTITVDGAPVTGAQGEALQAIRRKVGVVFQEFHLVDRLPVLINVLSGRFGRYSFWRNALKLWAPQDVADSRAMIARVGLAGLGDALARDLSGGQRQRVAIARAMVQEPLILLGDEPVASLDPVTARSVMQLIRELTAERGLTTILSLHDVALAKEYCRRAIAVSGGRIVYDGPMDAVTDDVLSAIYARDNSGVAAPAGDMSAAELALMKGCGKPRPPKLTQT